MKVHITFDPAIPLLGIYRKGTLSRLCTRARVRVCRAALFVIPQNRGNSYIPFMDQGSISWVTASQWTAQQLGCQCHGRMCVLHSDRGPILSTELRTCLHPQKCWSGKCSERLYQMFTLQSPLGSCWGRRDGMCWKPFLFHRACFYSGWKNCFLPYCSLLYNLKKPISLKGNENQGVGEGRRGRVAGKLGQKLSHSLE